MKGITLERSSDAYGNNILVIKKARGKLSIGEIEDILQYEEGGRFNGHYVIYIRATESTYGGSGWMDETQPKGDVVELLEILESENCPICKRVSPLIE